MSAKPTSKVRTFLTALLALAKLHWIALSVVGVLLLTYTLVGFFLVPYIARSQLTSYVTQTLHRQVSLGELRFNPFTLVAEASDFKLTEADGGPLVSFRHLRVNAGLASIWQRAISLQEVRIVAPEIDVVIDRAGSVNLARLAPATSEPAEPTAPPHVRIAAFAVSEGRVGLVDRTRERPFAAQLKPIRFSLTDFRTDKGHENAYRFAGTTLDGERLEWSGGFTVQPLGSKGEFRVEGLKLATPGAYLRESLPFRFTSGEASLAGTYSVVAEPLTLDVTLPSIAVTKLTLSEREGESTEPISIDQLDLRDLAFSYAKREVALKQIEIRGARVDVMRESDGRLNLERLASSTAPRDTGATGADSTVTTSAPSSASPSDWLVHVDELRLAESTLIGEDRTVTPVARVELSPVALTVKGWSSRPDARVDIDLNTAINKDARLATTGVVQLDPLDAKLTVDLVDLALPFLQPYLAQATAMTLHSGKLGVKGNVGLHAASPAAPSLNFKGDVRVDDLRTTDHALDADFIKWRTLALTGIDFASNPDRLTIDRIAARQPYANVLIAQDATLNVTSVLGAQKSAGACDAPDGCAQSKTDDPKKQTDRTAPAMPMRIRTVQISDGSANFADYSIAPSFATGILGLNGTVTGLSSDPGSRAKVKLDGKVDKYAPVDITGEVNLLAAAKYTDLAMNFRNMELTTFNPYSGKFAGYNISKGKLSTELKYKVQDRKLDAQHHIVVDNLEFGDKTDSKDAAPIPIKLAVALLKDRNGVIDVQLPVTGTLDDPRFRLGPIIWKALLGLLTKIVTAPFAAIGALFGGGDELAYVDFQPGSAELSADSIGKLESLAKALIDRPQLRLDVPVTLAEGVDKEALARKAYAVQVPSAGDVPLDNAAKTKRVALLEAAYLAVTKVAPAYPPELAATDADGRLAYLESTLVTRLEPDPSALSALARERARVVQDALLAHTELNAERVFITTERAGSVANENTVRMEMKLE